MERVREGARDWNSTSPACGSDLASVTLLEFQEPSCNREPSKGRRSEDTDQRPDAAAAELAQEPSTSVFISAPPAAMSQVLPKDT